MLDRFSTHANVEFNLNSYDSKEDVYLAVDRLQHTNGQTNIVAGLRLLYTDIYKPENGDRPGAENVVFILTDGEHTEEGDVATEASIVRSKGISMFFIHTYSKSNFL